MFNFYCTIWLFFFIQHKLVSPCSASVCHDGALYGVDVCEARRSRLWRWALQHTSNMELRQKNNTASVQQAALSTYAAPHNPQAWQCAPHTRSDWGSASTRTPRSVWGAAQGCPSVLAARPV